MANRRWGAALLAVASAVTVLSLPAPTMGATRPADETAQVAAGTVRLVTGDRVTLDHAGNTEVVPGPGREDIGYATYRQDGDVYVLPADAAAPVAEGRLDPQLFNVSGLVEAGFDERRRDHLQLIVSHGPGSRAATRAQVADAGGEVTGQLRSARSLAVRADHADLPELWRELVADGSLGVWLDRPLQLALADSVPQVGAPEAWAAGYDGTGVTVAVVDSGVDAGHPDLAGNVVASANFTDEAPVDLVGHGTHVASTVAGTGAASGGANRGVAPGASLLSVKACHLEGCDISALIAGMEWAVAQGAAVVNMSLGGQDSPGLDPLEQAVENLTASSGALFVISAGNSFNPRTVNSPGSADSALTVGAVDGADQLADFSSEGPRVGDSALKPDITAPGVEVTAARSQHSPLAGDAYTTQQGTSMAAPHVAGAAAILAQRHPDWTPAQLKSALMGSATPTAGLGAFAQGAGRLEVLDAVNQQVTAQPASVSLGAVAQDTGPGQTIPRTVTYRNHGAADVTLALSLSTLGPDGAAAPAGMFTLGAGSVTVPAGGQASVTLTADVGLPAPGGLYSGWVTAAGGGVEVRTPFGLERAARITLDHIGRGGGAPVAYSTVLLPVSGGPAIQVAGQPGPVTVFAPVGSYLGFSSIFDVSQSGVEDTMLIWPRLDATGTHTLTFDARQARPVSIGVPNPAAQLEHVSVAAELHVDGVGATGFGGVHPSQPFYLGQAGPGSQVVGFGTKVEATHYVPGPDGGFRDAPAVYHTGWFFQNNVPAGLVRNVTAANLATVDARHAAHRDGTFGYKDATAHPGDRTFTGAGRPLPISLPFDHTEYYHTEGNIRWESTFDEEMEATGEDLLFQYRSALIRYAPGSSTVQWWNRPVYGPALASPQTPVEWVIRRGDRIEFYLPLFGDGDGHAGWPHAETTAGTVTLTRDGRTLYQRPYDPLNGRLAIVPPDYGTYQLTATAQRGGPVELSTRVAVSWTFGSATVNDGVLRLPLWSVQLTPPLDPTNTAPAGQAFTIPLRAQPQPGSAAAGLRQLTLQFSVDDGATWQSATVSPAVGGGHVAQLTHPNLDGFVSLRATATDWAGNSVVQEVIRAYRIR